MWKPLIGIAAAALALGMTGCASGSTDEPAAADSAAEIAEGLPLAAEEVAPSEEDLFLADARHRLASLGAASVIPNATDAELVDAGQLACDQMRDEVPFDDVTVVDGEERVQGSYLDSSAIATAGLVALCPDLNGKMG